jgi:hypothetical protein
MHDPSATEQDTAKHAGKAVRHNAGHAPGWSPQRRTDTRPVRGR